MKDQNDIIAQALTLNKLIDFQSGAVVSRTLTDRTAGTITLFAFDKGQGLSEHSAPYDAFVYAVEGEAEVSIAGKAHTVTDGQIIIMPANVPHALKATSRFKMLLVMIRS